MLMACCNLEKGEEAAAKARAEHPKGEVRLMQLDLADPGFVKQFAEKIRSEYDHLDLLVNNARMMAPPYSQTTDGFELQFGINHLGHFALTGLLLDLLKHTPNARIVTVSNYAHYFGRIHFHDLNSQKAYQKWLAYGQSKLANLLFAYELQRRLSRRGQALISVMAHPGYAATNLQHNSPLFSFLNPIMSQSQEMGALPILYAATRPEIQGGEYVGPDGFLAQRGYPHLARSSKSSHDEVVAQRLWEVSEELTGVEYDI